MRKLGALTAAAALALAPMLTFVSTASAFDFGSGPGCSPIEGVDATALGIGDTFEGRIGTTAVSGFNKNGKPADNSDTDAFTDSVEECINDALVGFCTTILGNDDAFITVTPGGTQGRNNQQQLFTVVFDDVSNCAVTQCSDRVDNDADTFIDFPADPECTDYDDDDESS